jgi:uncharacterized membrane protein
MVYQNQLQSKILMWLISKHEKDHEVNSIKKNWIDKLFISLVLDELKVDIVKE